MKPNRMAAAVLTFSLALGACSTTKRTAVPIKPPAERLVCERLGTRPTIPAEYQIDWTKVGTVAQARAEHGKYVATIRSREKVIIGYIVHAEGVNFVCASNAEWVRDFFAELPDQAGD